MKDSDLATFNVELAATVEIIDKFVLLSLSNGGTTLSTIGVKTRGNEDHIVEFDEL